MSQPNVNDVCLVMLPGMDGTGLMFAPLIAQLPTNICPKIIPIPETCFSSHRELAKTVMDDFPEGPCIILAESFSGRTAYELCLMVPERINHVLFAASFLVKPSRLSGYSKYLPLFPLKNDLIPDWCLSKLLFGVENAPIELLHESLSQADSALLRNRLGIMAKMAAPEERIDMPCTIIKATRDYLVNAKAQQSISDVFSKSDFYEMETGHFVLQAVPKEVATVLSVIIDGYVKL